MDGNTITLQDGWNWISYRPQDEMAVDEALKNLVATTHDVIKGKAGFAMYNGAAWIGSLEKMMPGAGYMVQSQGVKSFNYPATGPVSQNYLRMALLSDDEATDIPSSFEFDLHKYESNMAVVARLYEAESLVENPSSYLIAAFVDGECRGVSVEKNGYMFLTIHGDVENERVSFLVYNKLAGTYSEIKETVLFNKGVAGTFENPQNLVICATGIEAIEGNVCMVCTDKQVRLYGNLSMVTHLTITDMSGVQQQVYGSIPDNGVIDASGLAAGMYVVSAYTTNGIIQQKFVRR